MRQSETKKRNIIIGVLCGVLLLMVVGYAAFNSVLNIKGTSSINSNWDIKITAIKEKNKVGGATTSLNEDGTEKITGIGTLSATFETNLVSPKDSIEYDITVTNKGTIDAKLEKITPVDLVTKTGAVIFTRSEIDFQVGDVLKAGESKVLTVKVEYDDVTSQPGSTIESFTINLDYVQVDGELVEPEPTPFTGTVYRWTTDQLGVGDSIVGVETTTDPTTLGKNYYLRHDVIDNKITVSYVCFVTDTEHCMRSGADYYETNKSLLQGQGSWFTANGGSVHNNSSDFTCVGGGFDSVYVLSDGVVRAGESSQSYCRIDNGYAYCINGF